MRLPSNNSLHAPSMACLWFPMTGTLVWINKGIRGFSKVGCGPFVTSHVSFLLKGIWMFLPRLNHHLTLLLNFYLIFFYWLLLLEKQLELILWQQGLCHSIQSLKPWVARITAIKSFFVVPGPGAKELSPHHRTKCCPEMMVEMAIASLSIGCCFRNLAMVPWGSLCLLSLWPYPAPLRLCLSSWHLWSCGSGRVLLCVPVLATLYTLPDELLREHHSNEKHTCSVHTCSVIEHAGVGLSLRAAASTSLPQFSGTTNEQARELFERWHYMHILFLFGLPIAVAYCGQNHFWMAWCVYKETFLCKAQLYLVVRETLWYPVIMFL